MIQVDNAEELVATAMAAQDADGNPLHITVRVLTDGNENAIEVITETTGEGAEVVNRIYIPADGGLVAMIVSMQSMMPAQAT